MKWAAALWCYAMSVNMRSDCSRILKLALALAFLSIGRLQAQDEAWNLLGETPPGDTPVPFPLPASPGNFAAERIAISHDRRTIYYTELNGYNAGTFSRLMVLTCKGASWSSPSLVLSGRGLLAPAFASGEDGLLLDGKITSRGSQGWAEPTAFRHGEKCHYLQQTKTGRFYFSIANREETEWDIVRAAVPGSGAADEKLGLNIAMHPPFAGFGMDYYIAPDEAYMILMLSGARDFPCSGASDLFITFSDLEGHWTKPRSLGAAVNPPGANEWRWGPCVTDDGKYLFFTRDTGRGTHVYWMRFDELRERLSR